MKVLDLSTTLRADVSPFNKAMDSSATSATSSFNKIAQAGMSALGGAGLLRAYTKATKAANAFGQSLADISAITDLNIEKIGNSIKKLPNYLGDMEKVANTMYEIISSGFRDIDESALVEFQKAISVSARVIRADVYNTGNAITTLANAYKMSMSDIIDLQDWFYLTVREGKAHGDELARTLGLVVNNASEAGIELNELGAAISILSRTQSTSQSMIGLNQMINSIIKPTLRAQAAARKWGIELGASALESKGLTAILTELNQKVGGNVEALEKMFGNIRAGRAILSLTGKQFQDYIKVLGEYDKGAGSGIEALKKQIDTAHQDFVNLQTQVGKTWAVIGKDIEPVNRLLAQIAEASLQGFGNTKVISRYVLYVGILYKALQKVAHSFKSIQTSVDNLSRSMGKMANKAQVLNTTADSGSKHFITTAMLQSHLKSQIKALEVQKITQNLTSAQIYSMVSRQVNHQFSYAKNGSLRDNLTGKFVSQDTVDTEATKHANLVTRLNAFSQSKIQQQIDDLTRLSKGLGSGNLFDKYQGKLSKINKQDTLTSFMLKMNPSFSKMEAMAKRNVEARYRQDMDGNWYDPLKKGYAFIDYQKAVNEEQARILRAFAQTRKDFENEVNLRREVFLKAKKGQRVGIDGMTSQQRFERRYGAPNWYTPRGMGRSISQGFKGLFSGGALSGLATIGTAIGASLATWDLGRSIGEAIGKKFKFSETTLFKWLADLLNGNKAGTTQRLQQENNAYNTKVIRERVQKEVLSSELLTEQQRLEIMGSVALAKTQEELNKVLKQKIKMEQRSLKTAEKNSGITSQKKAAEGRLFQAEEALMNFTENKLFSQGLYITPKLQKDLPMLVRNYAKNAKMDSKWVHVDDGKSYTQYDAGFGVSAQARGGTGDKVQAELRKKLEGALLSDPVIKDIISKGGFTLADVLSKIGESEDSFTYGGKTYSGKSLASLKELLGTFGDFTGKWDKKGQKKAVANEEVDLAVNKMSAHINSSMVDLNAAMDKFSKSSNMQDLTELMEYELQAYELLSSREAQNVLTQQMGQIDKDLSKLETYYTEVSNARNKLITSHQERIANLPEHLSDIQKKQITDRSDTYLKRAMIEPNSQIEATLNNMRVQTDKFLRYKDRLSKANSKAYYNNLVDSMQTIDPMTATSSILNNRVATEARSQRKLQDDINKLRAESLKADKTKRSQLMREIQYKEIELGETERNLATLNTMANNISQAQRAKIEMQKATGKITESQAIQQELSLERTRINSINIQITGVKRLTEEYYTLASQRVESEKRIVELNKQLEEQVAQRTRAIMDATQDFTRQKDERGRLTNEALYHSLNLMARLVPNMGGLYSSKGRSTVSRYTADVANVSSPRAAQNAQSRLADVMDAYVTQQKYQAVSVGDNVKKIVDILSKDTPIRLN